MKLEQQFMMASKIKKNNIKTAMLDSELLIANVIKKDREFVILNSRLKN